MASSGFEMSLIRFFGNIMSPLINVWLTEKLTESVQG